MIDTCAVNIIDIIDQKQEILGTESLEERAEKMIRFIDTETQIFMIEKDINTNLLEAIDEASANFVGGYPDWMKLSWFSNALGNKGGVCTATIECQNNCN